ncbi:hypothetical protein P153DRAFT_282473 [Dothidotthia symphoricarpi CBS 119687]|uniref:Rhodopsin domain-containing protein n=1 Tax=Dothidotthia symphoricarpi CBS 119687 TaxID=1392245 RepID=A0A6A6ANP7_9PLEO|nr:uncharacterized protein P153DRAFT_282473 [Dothidotthia symphoricarpi CBS 119687]KAF2133622.1 hypothetical protein P153DRAFT_282473 [Dothidotthia symphoricarpi CBS 119687]
MHPVLPKKLAGTCATLCALGILTTALRCYTCLTWYSATILTGIHYGTGRRTADISLSDSVDAMRCWYLCFLSYAATITFAKISAGFFFLRISGVMTLHRVATWIVTILAALVGFVYFFLTAFQCRPVTYFWTRMEGTSGSCISIDVIIGMTYLYGSVSLLTDVAYGALLCVLIWNLRVDRRTKMLISPLLAMACIASYAAAIRMPYIKNFKDPDFLYATVYLSLWSTVECGLSVIATNLATLRPLIGHIAHTSRSLYTRSSQRTDERQFHAICAQEPIMVLEGVHGKPHITSELCIIGVKDIEQNAKGTESMAWSWRRNI